MYRKWEGMNDRSPLHQNVCECGKLTGEEYATCSRESILSHAIITADPSVKENVSDGVKVFVTETHDFEELLAYVLTHIPAASQAVISSNANGRPMANVAPQPVVRTGLTAGGRWIRTFGSAPMAEGARFRLTISRALFLLSPIRGRAIETIVHGLVAAFGPFFAVPPSPLERLFMPRSGPGAAPERPRSIAGRH
jgi:hypothetical protein